MFFQSKFLAFSVFVFFLISSPFLSVSALSEDLVNLSLIEAEAVLTSAYEAVLKAEQAGANVSVLLDKLNLGGDYLAEAHVWYRIGAFENASDFAGLCYDAVAGVRGESLELQVEATRVGDSVFNRTVIGSTVGVVISVVLCFVAWRFFRHRYYRRVLRLRPEVSYDES